LRIGLIIYGQLSHLSGGYIYDRKLVDYLTSQGDEVKVISIPWRDYPLRIADNLNFKLIRQLREMELDVLLQDELNHPSLFLVNRQLKKDARFPIVSIVHHLRSNEVHSKLEHWIYQTVERAYLKTIDAFIFNSRTTSIAVQTMIGQNPCNVIAYPGGDRLGKGMRLAAISQRSQSPGPIRLVFLGNLIPRKGLHTLLHAVSSIMETNWTLEIIGRLDADPLYAGEMQNLAKALGITKRVMFRGQLDDAEVIQTLSESHIMIVPSSYEGFGIIYLEGMGFGVIPVATTAGAASEIIQQGENGYLVQPDNSGALASLIENLAENRSRLEQVSLAARRHFNDFPSWQDSTSKIRDFLVSLCNDY